MKKTLKDIISSQQDYLCILEDILLLNRLTEKTNRKLKPK